MTLSKRERAIRFLELDDEPDKCPIFTFGFETSGWGMEQYYASEGGAGSDTLVKRS